MEQYLVSARKYRPATFKSVVGQRALTATLSNAIASGRLAHSYLFCGSRGVGKTSCARIMAKTINCEHPTPDGEACNECASCRAFNSGNSLNIIELDAASNNSVDDMRALIDQVQIPPSTGRYRVFIIDEVHMLSPAAFNAFLKTLEEPPAYVIFILATTEKHKILPTILSRCQIYDFSRITIQDMIEHLQYVAEQEGITAETSALNIIARKADGAMRDALSIFDQVASSTRGNITYQATLNNLNVLDYEYYNRLTETFLSGDVLGSWLIYKEIRDRGFDSQFFINGLGGYFRDLMVAREPRSLDLLEAGDDAKKAMAEMAAKCDPRFLYKAVELCNDADLNYRVASNKQLLIELTLAKICQLQSPSPAESAGTGGGLKKIARVQSPAPTQAAAAAPAAEAPAAEAQAAEAPAAADRNPRNPRTPTPPAATPAAAAPRRMPRGPHLSLRGMSQQQAQQAQAAPVADAPKQANPYTDADVLRVWQEYADANPTEHILINTMRTSLPVKPAESPDGDRYVSMLENERQMEIMREHTPAIERLLHSRLGNDYIKIEYAINQGQSSPVTWTQREVLDHMLEEIPHLKQFMQNLGLKMA